MELIKYSDVGRALLAAEIDGNWTAIQAAIDTLQAGGLSLTSVQPSSDGARVEFIASDGSVLGTFTLPSPLSPMGEWQAAFPYLARQVVTEGGSSYLCAAAHTSGTFADDLAAGKWMPLGGGIAEPPTALDVSYTPVPFGILTATELQGAVDQLAVALAMTQTVISDLEDELEIRLTAIEGRLDALEAA